MPLAAGDATLVAQTDSNADQAAYTTGTATPPANAVLLAFAGSRDALGLPPQPTASGWGLTWTLVATITSGTVLRGTVWRAVTGGSPGSGSFTATWSRTQEGAHVQVMAIANADLTTPLAQAAATNEANGVTSLTVTLGSAVGADNLVAGFFLTNQNSALTVGSGFTEIFKLNHGGTAQAGLSEVTAAQDTTVDATTASARIVGLAVEIASGTSTQTIAPPAVEVELDLPAPTIDLELTIAPPAVVIDVDLPAPTIARVLTIAPPAVVIDVELPTPTIDVGAPTITLAPPALTIDLELPTPTIALGALTIAPPAVVIDVDLPAPMIALATTIAPPAVVIDVELPQPTVSMGTLTIAPPAIAVELELPVPTITTGALVIAPPAVAIDLELPTPTIALGALTIAPDAVVVELALPVPTIDVAGAPQAITPPAIVVELALPVPTIDVAGGDRPAIRGSLGELW